MLKPSLFPEAPLHNVQHERPRVGSNDGESNIRAAHLASPSPSRMLPASVRPGAIRRYLMLFLFCFAEFMDSFIGSALYPAIRVIQEDLNVSPADITWVFAAYSATFAAFLLISGRLSDVYSAKWTFITGAVIIGSFSLGSGFFHDKVALFVLRAMAGIGAAMTVPSALSLIVEWFPSPSEQARGIALFGGSGALGNVLGVVIGGAFVQWANWRWILWFTAIIGFIIALTSFLAVPASPPRTMRPSLARLDLGGVSLITTAVILFVYAVTSGSASGWKTARVLAPFVVSVLLAAVFFIYEAKIDPALASLPPSVWKFRNVPILIGIALLPFLWWAALFFQLMPLMQDSYGWSPIITSIHFLPTGICSMAIASFVPRLVRFATPKWALVGGLVLELVASALLPFANSPARYYSFLIPALVIGTIGTTIVFSGSNIAVFMNTPPEMAGVVGAVYNSALQLGIALGLAIVGSITTSVSARHPDPTTNEARYAGIAAGYWFIFALVTLLTILVPIFYQSESTSSPSRKARDEEARRSAAIVADEEFGLEMHERSARTTSDNHHFSPPRRSGGAGEGDGDGRRSGSRSSVHFQIRASGESRTGAQSRLSFVVLPPRTPEEPHEEHPDGDDGKADGAKADEEEDVVRVSSVYGSGGKSARDWERA